MTTIDPRNGWTAGLHAPRSTPLERARAAAAPAGAAATPDASGAASAVLAHRIRGIAPDDPDRRRKAVRVFLESELLREFGAQLAGDPRFATMVDAVQQQMQEDAQTAAAADALADLLLARAGADRR